MGFLDTLTGAFKGSSGDSVDEIATRQAQDRTASAKRAAAVTSTWDPFGETRPAGATSQYSDGTRYFGGPAANVTRPANPERTSLTMSQKIAEAASTLYAYDGVRFTRTANYDDNAARPVSASADPSAGGIVDTVTNVLARVIPREVNIGIPAGSAPGAVAQPGIPTWALGLGALFVVVGTFLVLRGRS